MRSTGATGSEKQSRQNWTLLHPSRHAGQVNMTKLNQRICRLESWDGFHRRLSAVWRRLYAKFVGSAWRTLPCWQPGAWQMMRGLMNPCSVSQSSSLTFVVFQKWEFALTFAEEQWAGWQSAWPCDSFVFRDNSGRQTSLEKSYYQSYLKTTNRWRFWNPSRIYAAIKVCMVTHELRTERKMREHPRPRQKWIFRLWVLHRQPTLQSVDLLSVHTGQSLNWCDTWESAANRN